MLRGSRRLTPIALSLVAVLALCAPALAVVPSTMSYQGMLTNGAGVAVPDGAYGIIFRIFDVPAGGTALWTESQPTVSVASGLFSTVLGSTTALGLAFDRQYWLGISVDGGPELSPRTPLTSVPYAMATRTPMPGVASVHYGGSYSVIGNANFGNPIQLFKDQSIDITAPADGYVVVHAAGYVTMVLVTTGSSQYAVLQVAETTGQSTNYVNAESGQYQWIGFQFAPNNGYWDWSFAVERVFPVTAGTHRYSFCTGRYGAYSPTGTSISNLNMIATYFPTSYGAIGAVPAEAPTGAALTPFNRPNVGALAPTPVKPER